MIEITYYEPKIGRNVTVQNLSEREAFRAFKRLSKLTMEETIEAKKLFAASGNKLLYIDEIHGNIDIVESGA